MIKKIKKLWEKAKPILNKKTTLTVAAWQWAAVALALVLAGIWIG